MAIFGGRNDKMFKEYRNVALNDLHLYDIEKNEWTNVESFGCYPEGRYGHAMVSIQGPYNSAQLIIFGG